MYCLHIKWLADRLYMHPSSLTLHPYCPIDSLRDFTAIILSVMAIRKHISHKKQFTPYYQFNRPIPMPDASNESVHTPGIPLPCTYHKIFIRGERMIAAFCFILLYRNCTPFIQVPHSVCE